MSVESIKCKNDQCKNQFRIEANSLPKPILFCSQTCLNPYLQSEGLDANVDYDDPKKVRELVQNLVSQTRQMQKELEDLRRIKKTYLQKFDDLSLTIRDSNQKLSFDLSKTQRIKCKNDNCNNIFTVQVDNGSKPILFCSQTCIHPLILQNKNLDSNFNYESSKQVRELVQGLVAQTIQIQNELEHLKKIRNTYFGLFRDNILKKEVYKRNWSFKDDRIE
jgi:hypothetical protein